MKEETILQQQENWMDILPKFMYRLRIGSVDLICTTCALTIANANTEPELVRFEDKHICVGMQLSGLVLPESMANTASY